MSPHSDSLPGHHHADIDWEVLATQLENRGELHLPVFARTAARLRELIGPEQEVRRTLDMQGEGKAVAQYQRNIDRHKELATASFDVMKGLKKISDRSREISISADGLKSRM